MTVMPKMAGFFLVFAMTVLLLTGCQNSATKIALDTSMPVDKAHSTLQGDLSETELITSDPDKLLEGDVESNYYGGPLFAYHIADDTLLAYCYADVSTHDPYVLSDGADTNGSINEYTFEEFDLTVYYFFDSDYDVWRIFNYLPEDPMMYMDNSSVRYTGYDEYNVYYDRTNITTYADSLIRLKSSVSAPRYITYDEVLFYSSQYFDPESILSGEMSEPAIDLDGDGKDEEIFVGAYFSYQDSSNYAIAINREVVVDVRDMNFVGIMYTDIQTEDQYKEIICWFTGTDANMSYVIIRYIDGEASYQIYSGVLEVKGDGIITVTDGTFLDSRYAIATYSVSDDFTFTRIPSVFEMNLEITAISDVPVQFLQDGVYVEGNLAAGDVITCYQTDYESLVYFRTSDGREGIFSVNVSQIEPGDIESGECFEGLFFGG